MIPKKIHFTWFSNDPYPEKIQNCIDSWKEFMPEYEFVHWDMSKIKDIDSPFLHEAISVKKWAFAADFVRLWALYHEGGIYLDTDCMVFKSFDELLNNECFIGKECSYHITFRFAEQYLSSHCMGAIPHHSFIKKCLEYYEGRHFITSSNENLPQNLKYDMTLLPFIQSEIAKEFGYNAYPSANKTQYLKDNLVVYPVNYLDPLKKKKVSYCRHLAVGSWRHFRKTDPLAFRIAWRLGKVLEFFIRPFGFLVIKLN